MLAASGRGRDGRRHRRGTAKTVSQDIVAQGGTSAAVVLDVCGRPFDRGCCVGDSLDVRPARHSAQQRRPAASSYARTTSSSTYRWTSGTRPSRRCSAAGALLATPALPYLIE